MANENTGIAPETPEPTLEQIASEFTVQQTAPAQTAPPVATESPKFDSAEDYQAWSANQLATVSQQLNSVTSELDQRKSQEFIETQDKAVNSAIERIRTDVELPDSFIEGRLHVKYSRDENFRKIFDNRAQNPAAYDRALGVVANELKTDSQWQPDPQGAENARAIKDLQKNANRAATTEDPNEKYRKAQGADWEHMWEKIKAGG